MPNLFRIVYCSRSLIPHDLEIQKAELEHILAAARRNNVRDGITGALLFTEGSFAQALEGSLADIEAALARIERDPRHDHVRTLELGPITARDFPAWSMAFAGKPETDDLLLGTVLAAALSEASPGAGEVLRFLRRVIATEVLRRP